MADKRSTYDWLNYAYRMENARADSAVPYEETTDKETGDEYMVDLGFPKCLHHQSMSCAEPH